tara:strand:- start:470 stop:775 length:306 start_codon:yes stop_codon:yes gene_type:complete
MTRNKVQQMRACLSVNGAMSETQLLEEAFGYIRSTMLGSNKKYADMLRRGLKKGIIARQEVGSNFAKSLGYNGNTKFLYYAPEVEVPCSAALDNEWANESI